MCYDLHKQRCNVSKQSYLRMNNLKDAARIDLKTASVCKKYNIMLLILNFRIISGSFAELNP